MLVGPRTSRWLPSSHLCGIYILIRLSISLGTGHLEFPVAGANQTKRHFIRAHKKINTPPGSGLSQFTADGWRSWQRGTENNEITIGESLMRPSWKSRHASVEVSAAGAITNSVSLATMAATMPRHQPLAFSTSVNEICCRMENMKKLGGRIGGKGKHAGKHVDFVWVDGKKRFNPKWLSRDQCLSNRYCVVKSLNDRSWNMYLLEWNVKRNTCEPKLTLKCSKSQWDARVCSDDGQANAITKSKMPYSLTLGHVCRRGYQPITSGWEHCMAAARWLKKKGSSVGSVAHVDYMANNCSFFGGRRPRGCFRSKNEWRIHYNCGVGGASISTDAILCQKVAPQMEFFANGCCRYDDWDYYTSTTSQGKQTEQVCKDICAADPNCIAADVARPVGDQYESELESESEIEYEMYKHLRAIRLDCHTFIGSGQNFSTSCDRASREEKCFRKATTTSTSTTEVTTATATFTMITTSTTTATTTTTSTAATGSTTATTTTASTAASTTFTMTKSTKKSTTATTTIATTAATTATPATSGKPHIVFVLVDDMGMNDFVDSSDLSHVWVRTRALLPNAIYTKDSYTDALCAPSRRSLMAGRMERLLDGSEEFSRDQEHTLANKLHGQGYITYMVGKWHAGRTSWKTIPFGRGFDRYIGHLENIANHWTPCADAPYEGRWDIHYTESRPFERNSSNETNPFYRYGFEVLNCTSADSCTGRYINDLWDEKVTTWMQEHKRLYPSQPLFLYYAPSALRNSGLVTAPDHYYKNCGRSQFANVPRRNLCAAVAALDHSIGNVVDILEGPLYKGVGDDFVIIITSDNGGPTWGPNDAGSNWPLRGQRAEPFEGGVRVPALVWGKHPALKPTHEGGMLGEIYTRSFMHLTDWSVLVAEIGGYVSPFDSQPVDEVNEGVSGLWRAITTNSSFSRSRLIGRAEGDARWYRKGNMKLLVNVFVGSAGFKGSPHPGWWWPVRNISNDDYLEESKELAIRDLGYGIMTGSALLFDLASDQNERIDLSQDPQYRQEMKDMSQELISLWASGSSSASDARQCRSQLTGCGKTTGDEVRFSSLTQEQQTMLLHACGGQKNTTGPEFCLGDVEWCR